MSGISRLFPGPDGYYCRISGEINLMDDCGNSFLPSGIIRGMSQPAGRMGDLVSEIYFSCREKCLTVSSLEKNTRLISESIGFPENG
jgi:hypothetical protein